MLPKAPARFRRDRAGHPLRQRLQASDQRDLREQGHAARGLHLVHAPDRKSSVNLSLSLSLSAHDLPHVPAERVTVWSSPRTASARAACRVRTTSCLARTPRRTAARSGRAAATTTATSPAPASPALRPPARTAPAVTTAAEAEPSSVRAIRPELVAHRCCLADLRSIAVSELRQLAGLPAPCAGRSGRADRRCARCSEGARESAGR